MMSDGAWLFDFPIPFFGDFKWPDQLHASVIVGYSFSEEGLVKEAPILGVDPPAIRLHDSATEPVKFGSYWINYDQLFEKTVNSTHLKLFIIKGKNSEEGEKEESWIDPLLNFFRWIIDSIIMFFTEILPKFFTETIPDFFRNLISSEDESIEEKALREVKEDLDMLSSWTKLVSKLGRSAPGISEEDIPKEDLTFEFTYEILGAKFLHRLSDARTYMKSMGIEDYDMEDAAGLVTELDLEQSGFCIVIVEFRAIIAGNEEEGRYPIVCDEEGSPFWKSWHLYERIKEIYEEIQQGMNE